MKLVLAGATGFLGGEVLRQALEDPAVEEVLVLTRRALGISHPKVKEARRESFLDYRDLDLRGYDACIWCLGVTQGTVSAAAYVEITVGYVVAAAGALFAANPRARFCFVSGRSSDPEEKKKAAFARIKGRAEKQLQALGKDVFVFRPGYIKPTRKSGPRRDLARFFAPLGALLSLVVKDFNVDCDRLAACLLDVARRGSEEHLLLNAVIASWPKG